MSGAKIDPYFMRRAIQEADAAARPFPPDEPANGVTPRRDLEPDPEDEHDYE
jgi:hypothetical protein